MIFKRIGTHLFFLIFSLVFASLQTGCQKEAPPREAPPVPVTVMTVEPKNIPAVFQYIGVIYSSHQVEIRGRVTGYIDELAYVEGSTVKKGDLLFQLDPRPFQATLAQIKALLASQQAVLWEAERSVARYKPLYEKKAASQRDLDNAMASEMSAKASSVGSSDSSRGCRNQFELYDNSLSGDRTSVASQIQSRCIDLSRSKSSDDYFSSRSYLGRV